MSLVFRGSNSLRLSSVAKRSRGRQEGRFATRFRRIEGAETRLKSILLSRRRLASSVRFHPGMNLKDEAVQAASTGGVGGRRPFARWTAPEGRARRWAWKALKIL